MVNTGRPATCRRPVVRGRASLVAGQREACGRAGARLRGPACEVGRPAARVPKPGQSGPGRSGAERGRSGRLGIGCLHRDRHGRSRRGDRAGRRLLDYGRRDGGLDRSRSCRNGGRLLCGGRGRRRWRWRRTGREQGHRIDVSLRIARGSQAEVDVRVGVFDHAARSHRSDHGALTNRRTARNADRAEMHERQGVAGGRLDGHGLPARRDGAGEGDDARSGRGHGTAGRRTEVDATVLPSGVGVGGVERERSQHRPVDRPGPRARYRNRQSARADDHQSNNSPHDFLLVASFENEGRR
jgi:hypothetical protein